MLSLFAHILSVLLRCHKPQDVWQILDIITEPYSLYIHISWNIYSALNFITSWYFGPLSNVDHVQHLNSLVLVLQVQTSLRYPQMKDCTHTSQCPWIHSWKNTCTELLKYSKNVRVYHHMHSQWSQVLGKSVWRSLFSSFQWLHQQWSRARSTPPNAGKHSIALLTAFWPVRRQTTRTCPLFTSLPWILPYSEGNTKVTWWSKHHCSKQRL